MGTLIIKNENGVERGLRIVAGIGLLSLTVVGPKSLWGLIGFVPLITGLIGMCPLYRMLGISTCKNGTCASGKREQGNL